MNVTVSEKCIHPSHSLYKCSIAVDSWMCIFHEDIDYVWATCEEEAKNIYTKSHHYRRNKKGLTIEYIPYHTATRIRKIITKVVTEKPIPFLGGYEYECYKDVEQYYCSRCKYELINITNRYCPCCDAELFDEDREDI